MREREREKLHCFSQINMQPSYFYNTFNCCSYFHDLFFALSHKLGEELLSCLAWWVFNIILIFVCSFLQSEMLLVPVPYFSCSFGQEPSRFLSVSSPPLSFSTTLLDFYSASSSLCHSLTHIHARTTTRTDGQTPAWDMFIYFFLYLTRFVSLMR